MRHSGKASSRSIELSLPPADASKHEAWLRGAAAELSAQIGDQPRLRGCVRLALVAGVVGDERVLLAVANLIVMRLLSEHVIDAPSFVTDVAVKWDRTLEAGRMRVIVKRTTPPARRISAATRTRVSIAVKERWARVKAHDSSP
jgi:hypothetical protein